MNTNINDTTVTPEVNTQVAEVTTEAVVVTEETFKPIPANKIDAAIEAAQHSAKVLMNLYQDLALSVLYHVAKHGDIRVARKLLVSLHEGLHQASMQAYIIKYGTISLADDAQPYNAETNDIVFDREKKLQLGLALQNKWYAAKKQASFKPYNLVDILQAELDRAIRKQEKADASKGDFIPAEGITELSLLVSRLTKLERKAEVKAEADIETVAVTEQAIAA